MQYVCSYCNTPFTSSRKRGAKYCSVSCSVKITAKNIIRTSRHLIKKPCEECGMIFESWPAHKRRFCRRYCKSRWMSRTFRGPKNPTYKATKYIRPSNRKSLRQHIRDKYRVCQDCGATSRLHVHHIDGNHSNNDDQNLTLLCKPCHARHHRQQGQKHLVRFILSNRTYGQLQWQICEFCNSFFEWPHKRKTCSIVCRKSIYTQKRKGDIPWNKGISNVLLSCGTCGKTFERQRGKIKINRAFYFCSKHCQIFYAVKRSRLLRHQRSVENR